LHPHWRGHGPADTYLAGVHLCEPRSLPTCQRSMMLPSLSVRVMRASLRPPLPGGALSTCEM
jgi:hypothetical protein